MKDEVITICSKRLLALSEKLPHMNLHDVRIALTGIMDILQDLQRIQDLEAHLNKDKENLKGLINNQDYPFEKVWKELGY